MKIFRNSKHRSHVLFVSACIGTLGLYLVFLGSVFGGNLMFTTWNAFSASFSDPEIFSAIRTTLLSATVTTILALILGLPSAYFLSRAKFRGKEQLDMLLTLPIVIPPPTLGVFLLVLLQNPFGNFMEHVSMALTGERILFSWNGIIVAQFAYTFAFGVKIWKTSFDMVDPGIEGVARCLGGKRSQVLRMVTLPLAKNGLLAGIILAWTRAATEFLPIVFVCGAARGNNTSTIPIYAFLSMFAGDTETAYALCFIMIIICATTIIIFKKLGGKGYCW